MDVGLVIDELPSKSPSSLAQFGLMIAHPEFHDFFEKNFSTWDDCKQSIMLIKAGLAIKEAVRQRSGKELNGNEIVSALTSVINHADSRAFMVDSMLRFIDCEPTKQISDEEE